jgi:hypothetical protein
MAVAHVEGKGSNAGIKVYDASHVKTAARKRSILRTSRVTKTLAFLDGFFKSKHSVMIYMIFFLGL